MSLRWVRSAWLVALPACESSGVSGWARQDLNLRLTDYESAALTN